MFSIQFACTYGMPIVVGLMFAGIIIKLNTFTEDKL